MRGLSAWLGSRTSSRAMRWSIVRMLYYDYAAVEAQDPEYHASCWCSIIFRAVSVRSWIAVRELRYLYPRCTPMPERQVRARKSGVRRAGGDLAAEQVGKRWFEGAREAASSKKVNVLGHKELYVRDDMASILSLQVSRHKGFCSWRVPIALSRGR